MKRLLSLVSAVVLLAVLVAPIYAARSSSSFEQTGSWGNCIQGGQQWQGTLGTGSVDVASVVCIAPADEFVRFGTNGRGVSFAAFGPDGSPLATAQTHQGNVTVYTVCLSPAGAGTYHFVASNSGGRNDSDLIEDHGPSGSVGASWCP